MYKRKTKLSPIQISLIALAILVVIAVIVTFAVKKDEPKEPAAQSGIVYDDSAIEGGWETLSQEEIEQRLNDKVQAGMINICRRSKAGFVYRLVDFASFVRHSLLALVNSFLSFFLQYLAYQSERRL